jgi:hypothetical protein
MSFSADKVSHLKGAFSQRRFSSSKDPSESGTYYNCFLEGEMRYIMLGVSTALDMRLFGVLELVTSSRVFRLAVLQSNWALKPQSSNT